MHKIKTEKPIPLAKENREIDPVVSSNINHGKTFAVSSN